MKYLGFGKICDVVFGLFMVTWILARHIFYLIVVHSAWADAPVVIQNGCYRGKAGAITGPYPSPNNYIHLLEPFRDPEGLVCWNNQIRWGFLAALLFLQGLTLIWFGMIVRVAIMVLKGGDADDVRSDDEGNAEGEDIEEEDMEHDAVELPPYEEEVGVEAINLKGRTSNASRYRKSTSSASGVSLPGHSDRKELLGRIGCDKGV